MPSVEPRKETILESHFSDPGIASHCSSFAGGLYCTLRTSEPDSYLFMWQYLIIQLRHIVVLRLTITIEKDT